MQPASTSVSFAPYSNFTLFPLLRKSIRQRSGAYVMVHFAQVQNKVALINHLFHLSEFCCIWSDVNVAIKSTLRIILVHQHVLVIFKAVGMRIPMLVNITP